MWLIFIVMLVLTISVCTLPWALHSFRRGVKIRPPKKAWRTGDDTWKLFGHNSEEFYNDMAVVKLISKVNQSVAADSILEPLWDVIRYEASHINDNDIQASALISTAILSQSTLDDAIINYIAHILETPLLMATQVRNLFREVCAKNESIPAAWAIDLMASSIRDSALPNAVSVMLFNKGFHSLVVHRIAHSLWRDNRHGLAKYFQSLTSLKLGADIHPASCIGQAVTLATASGIVIGETAVVGNDCCLLHGVTLGGTGKATGDRHPKLAAGVFVGAGATILGNIALGEGSVINAGSVVTKPVEAFTRVGGVPSKLISKFNAVEYDLILEKRLSTVRYDDNEDFDSSESSPGDFPTSKHIQANNASRDSSLNEILGPALSNDAYRRSALEKDNKVGTVVIPANYTNLADASNDSSSKLHRLQQKWDPKKRFHIGYRDV